jgi:methionyl-tRNA formyltransferase
MRIVFMGTPDFAVPSLDILVKAGYDVVGVITATDKLLGRGKKKIVFSPVKQYAIDNNLFVLQPSNLKAEAFLDELRALKADLQIVVAFRMLPVVVWDMPPMGTVNLHGSLLPAFRGAAPINWAIARGARITGLTTFKLKHEIDTGSIIFHESTLIGENETAGDLYNRLMFLGAPLLLKTVRVIQKGTVQYREQDESLASHAPKVYHDKCQLDMEQDSISLKNFIHGMSPFPAAWIIFNEKKLKVFRCRIADQFNASQIVGTLSVNAQKVPQLKTIDGAIDLHLVQMEGKAKMDGKAFANGYMK